MDMKSKAVTCLYQRKTDQYQTNVCDETASNSSNSRTNNTESYSQVYLSSSVSHTASGSDLQAHTSIAPDRAIGGKTDKLEIKISEDRKIEIQQLI